jgi:type IV pilus assembly protein PilW
MVLETRLSQDMRAAMDIVTRDVRRAGYWQNAQAGSWFYGSASAVVSYDSTGYAAVAPASGPASSAVTYAYSKDADNVANPATEQFGVKQSGNTLQMKIGGGGYQDLTDPQTTNVTAFTVTPTVTTIPISCIKPCAASCPTVQVREYAIALTAQAANDPTVQRTLRSSVRLRNDHTAGACPV